MHLRNRPPARVSGGRPTESLYVHRTAHWPALPDFSAAVQAIIARPSFFPCLFIWTTGGLSVALPEHYIGVMGENRAALQWDPVAEGGESPREPWRLTISETLPTSRRQASLPGNDGAQAVCTETTFTPGVRTPGGTVHS